jgi:hypothetical protein
MEGHKNHQQRSGKSKVQNPPDLWDAAFLILFQDHKKIPQYVLSAGCKGRARKVPTVAPIARKLFLSCHASGSTTHS